MSQFVDIASDRIVTLTPNPALDVGTRIERVRPSVKLRCDRPRYDPGGGGINVARAVHFLGGSAVAIFPAGGETGSILAKLLKDEGIHCRIVNISEETRQNLTIEEKATGFQYRLVMPGPRLTERALTKTLSILQEEAGGAAFVVASGSLPDGAPTDFFCQAADIADACGAKMVVDSSGTPLKTAIQHGKLFLIKPSLRELQGLTGPEHPHSGDQLEAAKAFVAAGLVELIVVSVGAEGAFLVDRDGVRRFPAPPVAVQSTVGAGDSLVAGLLLALTRGQPLEDSMRFGMAAAAASLLHPGTQLCSRADVERLIGKAA